MLKHCIRTALKIGLILCYEIESLELSDCFQVDSSTAAELRSGTWCLMECYDAILPSIDNNDFSFLRDTFLGRGRFTAGQLGKQRRWSSWRHPPRGENVSGYTATLMHKAAVQRSLHALRLCTCACPVKTKLNDGWHLWADRFRNFGLIGTLRETILLQFWHPWQTNPGD